MKVSVPQFSAADPPQGYYVSPFNGAVMKKDPPLIKDALRKISSIDAMTRKNTGEASRPLVSSRTTSNVATKEEFHQATRAEFVKGLKKLRINPNLHIGSSATGATSKTSTCPY